MGLPSDAAQPLEQCEFPVFFVQDPLQFQKPPYSYNFSCVESLTCKLHSRTSFSQDFPRSLEWELAYQLSA
eukprot:3232130-Amphidinium_carterae.1